MPNKIKSNKLAYLIVFIFSIITCFFLYLTALNGRYMKIDDYYLFDKWASKLIELQ